MRLKQGYSWGITFKKFMILALEVILVGTIAYLTENNLYLFLLPLLEALKNFIKNGIQF